MATCKGCGRDFVPRRSDQERCSKQCGRTSKNEARKRSRAAHEIRFVGVDGEGVARPNGDHEYVLLSVGDQSLYNSDGSALSWRDIFPFLYDCFRRDPRAAYVGFYLGYDFTQWFRTLPENRAFMLYTREGIAARSRRNERNPVPFPVYVEDWEVDIHADKRVRLRPHDGKERPWLYVCDVGAFYQTSFLEAIDPSKWATPIVTDAEFRKIAYGKDRRASAELDETMIEYNQLENAVLARLMASLNAGFRSMGIHLRRDQWYGPGQAVAAWLDSINAPTAMDIQTTVPEIARDSARRSYFGGWFELFAHGHVAGTSYDYDINSAYPWIISRLPCLLHGRWKTGEGPPPARDTGTYRLVHATVSGDPDASNGQICGAMLHRTPGGRVLRPNTTAGWYWSHELEAAITAELIDTVEIDRWIDYRPCDCPSPLQAIAELYRQRLRVGKKTPEGRALRLVLNSCYGKMAQSVGHPKYANPIYASLITAGCRTMILEAIASHPAKARDLLMVATDGVSFRSPHPSLPFSDENLGEWTASTKTNLTLVLPGIYWDDETRERVERGDSPKLKSRGIRAKDLAASIIDMDTQFSAFSADRWPAITIPVSFNMVTARQALNRRKWELAGTVTYDDSRELSSDPLTKRATMLLWDDRGIIRTYPYLTGISKNGIESTPYDKRFGEELRAQIDADGMTPEGSVWDVLHRALE